MASIYEEPTFYAFAGADIVTAAKEAVDAFRSKSPRPLSMRLIFNELALTITDDATPDTLIGEYYRRTEARHG